MTLKQRLTQLITAASATALYAQVSLAQASNGLILNGSNQGAATPTSPSPSATPTPGQTSSGILGGANSARPGGTPGDLFGSGSVFSKIADTLIYIVGAVAVIILIIGGFRYVTSQGSSDQVKQAKDTILYAVIGIVVAILAYAIVKFVTTSLT